MIELLFRGGVQQTVNYSMVKLKSTFLITYSKASLFHFKVLIEGMLQDGDGEMPARELSIAGGGCWWGSMLGSSRQLHSRGFPLPACHTGEAASAQRSPGASLKKETNNWINGGSSEGLDKRADPLWLGGVSEAPGRAGGCRRWGGEGGPSRSSWRSWRGAWILTAVKIPSDTLSHTCTHSHTAPSCLWVLRHIPLTASNAAGLMLFLKAHMYTHENTKMHTHHAKRIIYFNHTIKDQQQSYSSHAHVVGRIVIERIREDFLWRFSQIKPTMLIIFK